MPRKGFKVISVHDTIYDKIKRSAKSEKMNIAEFIENLVNKYEPPPSPPPFLGEESVEEKPKHGFLAWPWPGPYVRVVTAPQVTEYKSTAWVLSEQYPEKVGLPQLDPNILKRIQDEKDEFKMEKILVISQKAWDKVEVWRWIFEWFYQSVKYEKKLQLLVVNEKSVPPNTIDKKYYDMGIYGDEIVAFLTLLEGWEREPKNLSYAWHFDPPEIEKAKATFEKLKNHAVDRSTIFGRFASLL
jgi:hypothetical protein